MPSRTLTLFVAPGWLLLLSACGSSDGKKNAGVSDAGTADGSTGGTAGTAGTGGTGGSAGTGGGAGTAGTGGMSGAGGMAGVGGVAGGAGLGGLGGMSGAAGMDAGSDAGCAPPMPPCDGVCSLVPPRCVGTTWQCDQGPGFESPETTCDGFDNDCDGQVDEGCPACTVDSTRVASSLFSRWDIDFDQDCNTYLTTLVSGPDNTTVVPANSNDPVASFLGNGVTDMGFALVDPDPANRRVVVTYTCCEGCNCSQPDGGVQVPGLTLMFTCSPTDTGCGCVGETNCPGFLDTPFLATVVRDTPISINGFTLSAPSGLAAGPGNSYFVGNFRPATCDSSPSCVACDPDSPVGTFCSRSDPNCCDTEARGRLARFTLPEGTTEPTYRVVHRFDGESIVGLASARDGAVYVGTVSGTSSGNLYRFDPISETETLIQSYAGAVLSVTQNRRNGDFYVEVQGASPKISRLAEDHSPLPLPAGVPANPPQDGVLQYGPDDQLYRLQPAADVTSTLDVYPLS